MYNSGGRRLILPRLKLDLYRFTLDLDDAYYIYKGVLPD